MPLLVHVSELAERQRRFLHRRFEATFIERACPDRGPQIVESLVSFRLGSNLAIRPLGQADALAAKATPPRVLASIASASPVFADFVETHSSFSSFLSFVTQRHHAPRYARPCARPLLHARAVPATRRSIPP